MRVRLPMRALVVSVGALLTATLGPAGVAEPPCQPLQPPRPICIPDLPTPPPVPTVPPAPVPTVPPTPVPTVPPVPGPTLTPLPTLVPSPVPTVPTLTPLPVPTMTPPTIPPIGGGGGGVRTPWVSANAGVMWYGPGSSSLFPSQPVGEAGGSIWLTRRIAVAPLQATMLMGSFLNGVYWSQGGAAWVSATPGCLLPYASPIGAPAAWTLIRQAAVLASGLDACGIEGLAYDPLIPGRVYASAYDAPTLTTLNPGGVYVSDDGGFHWRKLLGGIRGAGLAVGRPGGVFATIVAGYIQQSNAAVGSTPSNGSLSISSDDGLSWRSVVLPSSGCPDGVGTSQRLTATVAFNDVDQRIVYAGTNAGLYVSTDAGGTWRLARQSCGGIWGIAPATDGRVFFGDNNGGVYESDAAVTSPRLVRDLGDGWVQSLEPDPVDPSRVYAAVWNGSAATVFRIETASGQVTQLGNSLLPDLGSVPQPFPFSFQQRNGTAPSLFLARPRARLYVSTLLRGAFLRGE